MARRQISYRSETYCLDETKDGSIVKLGSKDKYVFESFILASTNINRAALYIFRYADGRTIAEYKYYELKIIDLANCSGNQDIILQSDDILLGVSHRDGCYTPRLYLFRPYYRRGAEQTLTSCIWC